MELWAVERRRIALHVNGRMGLRPFDAPTLAIHAERLRVAIGDI